MLLQTLAWAGFCHHSRLKELRLCWSAPPKPSWLLSLEIGAEGESSGAPHSVAVLTGRLVTTVLDGRETGQSKDLSVICVGTREGL